MKNFEGYNYIYFIGIGGIGMSALARFFRNLGRSVAGYDRSSSALTDELTAEGMQVNFRDAIDAIPEEYSNPGETLVVYTPAVPFDHPQLRMFLKNEFRVLKRSEVLGLITQEMNSICVAGTHGKTTVSTLTAHLFYNSRLGVNAFLGGISKNFKTNFLNNKASRLVVLEADEYDRSFLQLTPHSAVITSMDADHLDIYGTGEELVKEFGRFAGRIRVNGNLVLKSGLPIPQGLSEGVTIYRYNLMGEADFYVKNIQLIKGFYHFDLVTPMGVLSDLKMGIPGLVNVENAVAAVALALINDVTPREIIDALPLFRGISRRFEMVVNHPRLVYIDDYAHHPNEISATLESLRSLYSGKRITGVFQPHLFSRTRDFAGEFAHSLSQFDELILLPVYPAREAPIPGVDSKMIAGMVNKMPVALLEKKEVIPYLNDHPPEVLVTMGAGDIDRLVPEIKKWVELFTNS